MLANLWMIASFVKSRMNEIRIRLCFNAISAHILKIFDISSKISQFIEFVI